MYRRDAMGRGRIRGFDGQLPPDLWVLFGIIFFTFTVRYFQATAWLPDLMLLSTLVWRIGFVWQLLTYPFVGTSNGAWILLELLVLYWFSRDVFYSLGRRRFWNLILLSSLSGSIVASLVQLAISFGTGIEGNAFALMQGQRTLILIMIAAFAILYREATILLFFVLPFPAKYFIALEIVLAFIGFLGNKDLAGFIGVCTAVGMTVLLLRPGRARGLFRETRLRIERFLIQQKMKSLRKKRGFRVVPGGEQDEPDRWVH